MPTAQVVIRDFGSANQVANLRADIKRITGLDTDLNFEGAPFFTCPLADVGVVFGKLAADAKTEWVEYTVQFDY